MNRISEIEIAGKKYPLNFSVKAARAVDEKFGSLDKLSGVIGVSDNFTENMYNIHWMLILLMEQGAAYKKLVDGEDIVIPTSDDLEVLIGAPDLVPAQAAILQSIGLSMKPTVEVEPDSKNAETTQGK